MEPNNGVGLRLDLYVAEVKKITRNSAQNLIEKNLVLVNGKAQNKNYKIRANDTIQIGELPVKELSAKAEKITLDIVYEDDDIIVINKPSGMVVHPAVGNEDGTLVNALLYHCKDTLSGINGVIRPGIVHRIDKETSGLLVVAKNDESHLYLSSLLKTHEIRREYHALVIGRFKEKKGTVDAPIARSAQNRKKMAVVAGGRDAVTHYETIEEYNGFTYAKMVLETGRTHQIRVHMNYIGHPIAGDPLYGGAQTQFQKQHPSLFYGQMLHAKKLSFPHPRTKETMTFECPLPDYFTKAIELLKKQ